MSSPVTPKGPRELPRTPRTPSPISPVQITGFFTSSPNCGMDQGPRPQSIKPMQADLKHYHDHFLKCMGMLENWIESARELEYREPNNVDVEKWKGELKRWMSDMKGVRGRVVRLRELLLKLEEDGVYPPGSN